MGGVERVKRESRYGEEGVKKELVFHYDGQTWNSELPDIRGDGILTNGEACTRRVLVHQFNAFTGCDRLGKSRDTFM